MANIFQGWRSYHNPSNKYSNKKTVVDGKRFDSKREAKRYRQLQLLAHAGDIWDLQLQVRYELVVNGQKICDYVCDFQYTEGGQLVVEDAKGAKTPAYRLKKKLMMAIYNIQIKEV